MCSILAYALPSFCIATICGLMNKQTTTLNKRQAGIHFPCVPCYWIVLFILFLGVLLQKIRSLNAHLLILTCWLPRAYIYIYFWSKTGDRGGKEREREKKKGRERNSSIYQMYCFTFTFFLLSQKTPVLSSYKWYNWRRGKMKIWGLL